MINSKDTLKQKLLDSLGKKYLKGQRQAYIHYSKWILAGIIYYLYDDHGTISSMDIEDSEQNMKQ